jgi:hypothetical protein
MAGSGRVGARMLALFGLGAVTLLCAMLPSSAAAETDLHAFDPVLSLTGGCSVSTLDPVADPGPCPGTAGEDHPTNPFNLPRAVTTDSYGNIYVSNATSHGENPEAGIDVFSSSGDFITEIPDELAPGALAVDSEGNLYVTNGYSGAEAKLLRFSPTLPYDPADGQIDYSEPPTVLVENDGPNQGIAINPENDHLFRKANNLIIEYKSAAEDNAVSGSFGEGFLNSEERVGIAVDAAHDRIYASTWLGEAGGFTKAVRVFELAAPHHVICTLEESGAPEGTFQSPFLSLAADERTGNFFIYDGEGAQKVYEYEFVGGAACGSHLGTIEHGFRYTYQSQIAVDNGAHSPNGALNPEGNYLFVPSHSSVPGHLFAFGPSTTAAPVVESTTFSNVGEAEAELEAAIEPSGLETHYIFEYLTRQRYEEEGNSFSGAQVAGEGEIAAGSTPIDVVASADGLQPGTRYRFRVVAENKKGKGEREGELSTFVATAAFPLCPNAALRGGFSGLLPDCRAYELVTPPDTNARAPIGLSHSGAFFPTRKASPGGGAVSFVVEGGLIPGSAGTGSFYGDPYRSSRGADGWDTKSAGPSGGEAGGLSPGSTSPDQGYSFWDTGGPLGSAVIKEPTTYVRYPDGHSALVGRGSLGTDPQVVGKLISEGGGHIIFWVLNKVEPHLGPAIQLEPNAPPEGTAAVYDRTADEVTHVVSLLPGDETPQAGEQAFYEGASIDGRGVAFRIGSTLYLRHDNEETFEIGNGITFEGIAEGGARIFYLESGQLFRFDAADGKRTAFSSGVVTPVNVSADGSTAYFASTKVLSSKPNPNGAKAVNGADNLYRSEEGAISFVGTVTEEDMVAERNIYDEALRGLSLWSKAVGPGSLAADPSRTTPDGNVLLFESRAPLNGPGGYDPEGHVEVYRYDSAAEELNCLSCNPTLAAAKSDASLQSISVQALEPEPLTDYGLAGNLRADGNRAFFQSDEALVPGDVDGLQDVYEWEAQGVGSCIRAGGCIYLVSSGHSLRIDYLYATSDSGDDVFFRTSDILLGRDAEETPSIYDVRVDGGFPEVAIEPCQGESCRPGVSPIPSLEPPAEPAPGASDNVPAKRCPKGKRKVRRHGKTVCVKKKHHKRLKHQKKAGKSRGAAK